VFAGVAFEDTLILLVDELEYACVEFGGVVGVAHS
jgi:hypothetical protein